MTDRAPPPRRHPTRRAALRLGALGLLGWAGAVGLPGCAPRDDGDDGDAAGLGAGPGTGPGDDAAPLQGLTAPRRPDDPLEALLDDLTPSARALVAAAAPDEEAWLALVVARLGALPRLEPRRLHGPGRLRFGPRRARGPLSVTHVRLEDGGELPVHDHRDLCGVLFGISGRLPVRQFEFASPPALVPVEPGAAFDVVETRRGQLVPGAVFTHTRARDTIHGIATDGSGGEYLEVALRFSDTAGSRVMQVEAEPVDAGRYRARWA